MKNKGPGEPEAADLTPRRARRIMARMQQGKNATAPDNPTLIRAAWLIRDGRAEYTAKEREALELIEDPEQRRRMLGVMDRAERLARGWLDGERPPELASLLRAC